MNGRSLSLICWLISLALFMWVLGGTAMYLFLPTVMPDSINMSPGETIVSGLICLIAPTTFALAGGLIWMLSGRSRQPGVQTVVAHAAPANVTTAAPPMHPTSALAAAPALPAYPSPAHALAPPPIHPQQSQAEIMNTYLNEMTEFLMTYQHKPEPVRTSLHATIQAQTGHVLSLLDAAHRGRVIQFLHSARLLSGRQQIRLRGIDLSGTDLRFSDLRGANLAGVSLRSAALTGSMLEGANLSEAILDDADLRLTRLERAALNGASLRGSKLHQASLRSASLHGALLHDANLWTADLTGAQVTEAQLQPVRSLVGTILPDGTRKEQP